VDLLDRLRRQTGMKISAEDFRSVRTVGDMVDAVYKIVQA
jgi:acyl carrier protein